MWHYDKDAGVIARNYLIARCTAEFAHFDKNAEFIQMYFGSILKESTLHHTHDYAVHIPVFSATLATHAFGRKLESNVCMQEELFTQMCYIFVLYAANKDGIVVGKPGKKLISEYAALLHISESEMLWFFRKLTSDIWEITEDNVSVPSTFLRKIV